jgi:hypothetical protein
VRIYRLSHTRVSRATAIVTATAAVVVAEVYLAVFARDVVKVRLTLAVVVVVVVAVMLMMGAGTRTSTLLAVAIDSAARLRSLPKIYWIDIVLILIKLDCFKSPN